MNHEIISVDPNSAAENTLHAKLFQDSYKVEIASLNAAAQAEATKVPTAIDNVPKVVSEPVYEARKDERPPLAEGDYNGIAVGLLNQGIDYELGAELAKGFKDSRIDLDRLNKILEKNGFKLDLIPLETGLQLNLSKNGVVFDSAVSKTPEAREKGRRMSWENRWKEKLKDVDVKDFLARYEHTLKNQTITEEFLQSLRLLGKKASKDPELAKLLKERLEMDGIRISFERDSVSLFRSWPTGPSYKHAHASITLTTSFDGSQTKAESNWGGPYTVGEDHSAETSLDKASKMLFGPRPDDYEQLETPVEKRRLRSVIDDLVRKHNVVPHV